MSHGFGTAGLRSTGGVSVPGQNALCENPTTGGAVAETVRALLVAMDQWVDQGVQPPASNYPALPGRRRDGDRAEGGDGKGKSRQGKEKAGTPGCVRARRQD